MLIRRVTVTHKNLLLDITKPFSIDIYFISYLYT